VGKKRSKKKESGFAWAEAKNGLKYGQMTRVRRQPQQIFRPKKETRLSRENGFQGRSKFWPSLSVKQGKRTQKKNKASKNRSFMLASQREIPEDKGKGRSGLSVSETEGPRRGKKNWYVGMIGKKSRTKL